MIFHGFDDNNQGIEEVVKEDTFVRKLLSVDRIRSISEDYVLVSAASDREMYWEYQGTLDELKAKLLGIGVDIA